MILIFTLLNPPSAYGRVEGISIRSGTLGGGGGKRACSCGSRLNSDRTGGTGRMLSETIGYIVGKGGADGSCRSLYDAIVYKLYVTTKKK